MGDTRFRAWAAPTIGAPDGVESGRRRYRVDLSATVSPWRGGPPIVGGSRVLMPGPGDVAAVSPGAIRRRVPPPGRADAEGEYFAYIDFVSPDFPWRYASAHPGAGDDMSPWVALVAGADGTEVGVDAGGRGWISAAVTSRFPLSLAGRWAHVHERRGPSGWQVEASRLVCPRDFPDDADCLAMVVPLWRDDGTTPAWQAGLPAAALPVLHAWRFHTNAAGTFTSLARALAPMPNPPGLGRTSVEADVAGTLDRAEALGLLGPLDVLDPEGGSTARRWSST